MTRLLLAIVLVLAAACSREESPAPAPPKAAAAPPPAPLEFVGSEACASCHSAEASAWRESQHALAMKAPESPRTIRAAGLDGKPADFPVKYEFGVTPLQQYLLELPGGRLQAYTQAWDVTRKRWLDLYPHEKLLPGDELHWTGRQQNWNAMCADCHSTDVRKRYDPATATFDTRFAEVSVGCEACHGPGSRHVTWAAHPEAGGGSGLTAPLRERQGTHWVMKPERGIAYRSAKRETEQEIEVCAQCHSRRSQLVEGYRAGAPFLDHYRPALLTAPLYHDDGQQRDEVYTWGSFLSSRMYARGVTCSDCHEPHGAKLRAPGNALCAQCHATEKFDAPAHHHHRAGSKGAECVACHMPSATYMQIDPRRDHSFRVPRPDQSVTLGVPSACDSCHRAKGAKWAAAEAKNWLGRDAHGFQTFAETFHAAESGAPGAGKSLAALAQDGSQSPIARASALARLSGFVDPAVPEAVVQGVKDPSGLVRLAAVDLGADLPSAPRTQTLLPLLADPLRIVRIAAANALAELPESQVPDSLVAARVRATEEYVAAQRYSADRPEAHVNLGTFFARQQRFAEAQAEFAAALALDPAFVPAYVNSADAFRASGRDDESLRVLEEARAKSRPNADVEFALGLTQARLKNRDATIAALERAVKLGPDVPRYTYTLAVALHSFERTQDALRLLEKAARKWPANRNVLLARATMLRDSGDRAGAAKAAEDLLRAFPGDEDALALREELR